MSWLKRGRLLKSVHTEAKLSLHTQLRTQREASPPCNPKPFRQSPMKDGRVQRQETLTWPDITPGSATMRAAVRGSLHGKSPFMVKCLNLLLNGQRAELMLFMKEKPSLRIWAYGLCIMACAVCLYCCQYASFDWDLLEEWSAICIHNVKIKGLLRKFTDTIETLSIILKSL